MIVGNRSDANSIVLEVTMGEVSMNVGTPWAEIATALAVMGIITFLLLV